MKEVEPRPNVRQTLRQIRQEAKVSKRSEGLMRFEVCKFISMSKGWDR